jgi:hypothetical protein
MFAKEPFTEREAWIWMISSAAWKEQTVRVGRHIVQLERGQLCYSTRFLADAFGWHHSRLRRFLQRLEVRSSISKKIGTVSDTAPSVITITNYDEYQDWGSKPTQQAAQNRHRSDTNKNKDNKDNKVRDTKVSLDHPELFDRFWNLYPRKIGKGQAITAWRAATKKVDPLIIIEGLEMHMQDLTDKPAQFIPHASTWLNGERWADELEQHGDPFWDTFTWENSK